MGRLDGKVCLVTGAAQGQGLVESQLFAAEGAVVYMTDVVKPGWPKLKPGGMFAGDDFVDAQDTFPHVKHHRGGREEEKTLLGGWGVKTAVVRFAEGVGSPFFLTFADRARDATERTPWLDEADPASEWFAGHTNRELRRITASDIVAPVRAHRIYPAWYMFKKAGKS